MEKADPAIWLIRFLERRGLERPDSGTPLYSYRCSDPEFEELGDVLRVGTRPPVGYYERVTRAGAALFCLYAAEWWRRTHVGGPWKWAGILEGAGWAGTPFPRLYEVIEEGLGFWRRPLLRVGPNRGFLVTLACEGGLPLHLVTSEGTALRDYLLAVLEEFQLYRPAGYAPEELAARASELLPRSLQQDVVYRLSGQLIDEIWQLQRKVGSASAPVRELDRTDPGWRDRLPLLVPDDVARALLNPLVEEAAKLAGGGASGLRMQRSLRRAGDGLAVRGEVVVPASISEPKLIELFGTEASNLPSRFELYLEDEAGDRVPLALATQTERGERKVFRLEALGTTRQMEGGAACAGKRLSADAAGRSLGPVGLPGGAALMMDLPWIFANKSASDGDAPRELAFLGQGSVNTRHTEAFVAVPWDTDVLEYEGAECELVSEIGAVGRAVFRVRGAARFTDVDGNACRIRSAAEHDASPEYQLAGALLPGTLGSALVFHGAPSLLASDAEGRVERIVPERLEWHAAGHKPIIWRPVTVECLGTVDLRLVDADGLRHRDRAAVVPADAQIRLHPSSDFKKGQIELIGFQDAEVSGDTSPGLEIRVEHDPDEGDISLHCEAPGDPPADVSLRLIWPAGRALELRLPFPSNGSRFIAPGGRVLADEAIVPVDRLSGVVATATTTDGRARFFVSGDLYAEDVAPAQRHLFGVNEPLRQVIPGRFELDLRTLQESLRDLFAVSRDLGASVRLVVESPGSSRRMQRRLMVSRFDLSLVPDRNQGEVRLRGEDLGRLDWEDLENLHVEAIPLWRPSDPPVELEPVPGPLAPGRWQFDPERRAAGPWMILGRDGDWNRMRPLVWNVPGKDDSLLLGRFQPQAGGALATAVCIADQEERTAALDALLSALAEDGVHEDWHEVYAFLRRFRGLPASTLDVTERMIAAPRAAVVALLGAPDAGMFASVWSLLEELPFLWSIVPMKAWVAAGRRFIASLRHLEGYSGDVDALVRGSMALFLKEAPLRQSGFETLTDLMRVGVLGEGIEETSYLKMVVVADGRAALRGVLESSRQALLQAHAEDQWPSGPGFTNWLGRAGDLPKEIQELWQIAPEGARYQVPVLNGPAVAAIAATCDIPVERPLIFALRRLRRFDPQWFDEAYSCMLAIAVGVLYERDPERIGMDS